MSAVFDNSLIPDPPDCPTSVDATTGLALLDVDDVARFSRVSTKTVMRAIERGQLVASQLAERGCWRIEEVEMVAWWRRARKASPEPSQPDAPRSRRSSRTSARAAAPAAPRRRARVHLPLPD